MNLDINTLSKTAEGRNKILEKLAAVSNSINRENDLSCWNLYNNMFSEKDYDYLRKFGKYTLPAKVRHIPKQRPYVDWLVSRQYERTFQFSMTATDKKSLKRKYEDTTQFYLDQHEIRFRAKAHSILAKVQQIEQQKQQIMEMTQRNPQNEQELAQIQQAKAIIPQITHQLDSIQESLISQKIYTQDNIRDIEKYRLYTARDFVEELAQKTMKAYYDELDMKLISLQNMINKIVTGKEFYFVDYRPGDVCLTYKSIPPHNVFYQLADDVLWVQDLDWAGFMERKTPEDIIYEFDDKLSANQKNIIRESSSGGSSLNRPNNFVMDEDGNAVDLGNFPVSSGAIEQGEGVVVKRLWWVAERTVRAVQTPNKYRPGKYFTNFIKDEKTPIDEKNFYYKNGHWINRDDTKQRYNSDDTITYDSRNGGRLEKRIIYDRYKGVIIADRIYLSEKDPIQPRPVDRKSKTFLPIVGPTYNNITHQPYSLIWATRDIQRLINIVSYHRELMLAVAGTKVTLMDKIQKPEGMSDDEWRYMKKMGTAWIQTRKSNIGTVNPTFNQFQMLDESLSSSVQYFDRILENLDTQMGLIMGITRQAMGQTVNSDQVGTFQLSQQSTLLITEILYAQHDEVERRALSMAANIARQYLWSQDSIVSYMNEKGDEEVINIPANTIDMSDYQINLLTTTKHDRSISEIKQIALQNYKSGQMPFRDFMSLYSLDTMKELEKENEYFAREAQRLAAEAENAKGEQLMAIEQKKAELQIQIDKAINAQREELEVFNAKLEQRKNEFDEYIQTWEKKIDEKKLALDQATLQSDNYLRTMELVNEKESEDNVIRSNERATNINAKLQLIQTQLQAIQIGLNKNSEDKGHQVELKKIGVEEVKAKKMVKEHASDR